MKTILEDIKTKNFKPAYLIYGEEGRQRQDAVKKLEAAISESNGEKEVFEGPFDPSELVNSANTLSLFGGIRLILVKDSGAFSASGYDKLTAYLADPNPACVIIFNEKKADKRNKLYKALSKAGYCLECKKPTAKEVRAFAASEAKAKNLRFEKPAFDYFTANLEEDFGSAENELEKLAAYTMGRDTVTLKDVESVTTKKLENRIFDLIDAVGAKNPEKALGIFSNLMLLKESPVAVLVSVARQLRLILQYKFMSKTSPNDEIAKRTGVHPFVVKKAAAQSGNFTNKQLLAALADCKNLLREGFSGNMDLERGVEIIILKYTM